MTRRGERGRARHPPPANRENSPPPGGRGAYNALRHQPGKEKRMAPDNSPATPPRPRRPWLFPLCLLIAAMAAIVALTLSDAYLPHDLEHLGMRRPAPGSAGVPWGALLNNLALAAACGLYALPVLGMAGLLVAGGFNWALFGAFMCADVAIVVSWACATDDFSHFCYAYGLGIPACGLFFGALGGLFAGRLGWGVNRAGLLTLSLGFALGFGLSSCLVELRGDTTWKPLFSWPEVAVATAAMLLFVWWLLSRSSIGRKLQAIGADATAARLAGIDRGWAMFVAFALSAVGAVLFWFNLLLLDHEPFFVWFDWFANLIGIGYVRLPREMDVVVTTLPCTLPFLAIVACGGGLSGRGRVSLAALLCAALAVPMLDCVLSWAPIHAVPWLRQWAMPLLIIVGTLVHWRRD